MWKKKDENHCSTEIKILNLQYSFCHGWITKLQEILQKRVKTFAWIFALQLLTDTDIWQPEKLILCSLPCSLYLKRAVSPSSAVIHSTFKHKHRQLLHLAKRESGNPSLRCAVIFLICRMLTSKSLFIRLTAVEHTVMRECVCSMHGVATGKLMFPKCDPFEK